MPGVSLASNLQSRGLNAHSQLAQFGPVIDDLFTDVCSGDHPLVPREQEAALVLAVLDELGRGTHPGKLKEKLVNCLAGQEDAFRHAA